VGAAGALLSEIKLLVVVDDPIGASIKATLTAGTLLWVNDNQTVGSLVDSFYRTRFNAWGISTVHTQYRDVCHLDLRYRSPNMLIYLNPELPGIRLGLGIGRPVISAVLVLADKLAGITTRAMANIYYKSLHILCLLILIRHFYYTPSQCL
jgi:hypothetical protein